MLAIIGTAGRNTDAPRITRALYDAMHDQALKAMRDWGVRSLVSGGAAVADHLAVRAFLEGHADRLVLHLPAPFEGGRYVRPARGRTPDADTANRYHQAFSSACGIDSLAEIAEAIARGAETTVGLGFKDRNSTVAREATHMLALTFGPGREPVDALPEDPGFSSHREAGVKDGGTEDTWNKAWRAVAKRHVPLGWLERSIAPQLDQGDRPLASREATFRRETRRTPMPMTAAEELETRRKAGEGMQVPTEARASRTWLIEGGGLPTKVALGSTDCPPDVLLSIVNRDHPNGANVAYERVRRVHQGMLALDARPLQGKDQTYCGQGGLTIREGELAPGEEMRPGSIVDAEGEPPEETFSWRVVDAEGRSYLLTIPDPVDSFDLAESLAAHMRGTFHIERVDVGTMTVAEDMSVPGWNLEVAPQVAPRAAFRPWGPRRI